MAEEEPAAKRSKPSRPAAATMLRVESCILGPASAGRRGPISEQVPSPPEILRDVAVVSDPPSPAHAPPLELCVISDPGEDLDDELAMVFLRHLVARDPSLRVRCVVCNLRPAQKRAALMRRTLDALDLAHVPVGAGQEVVPETKAPQASWDFLPESAPLGEGQALLKEAFDASHDGALTLLCISALTDAAEFLENHTEVFRRKVREVVIMGGVQTPITNALLVPDDAANNAFDPKAAAYFYRRLQELDVPMVIVSRAAAYACPVPQKLYDELAATGNRVGVRVRDAQREANSRLWRRSHALGEARAHLPDRCDPTWFRATFCDGRGADLGSNDDVWDLVVGFNLYDVIALLACDPSLRRHHFAPHVHRVNSTAHALIGLRGGETNVRDAPATRAYLEEGILDGIRGAHAGGGAVGLPLG